MEPTQSDIQDNGDKMDISDEPVPSIHDFLSRHIPPQVNNTRKLCYRHRPDLIKKRMPDAFDFTLVQKQMEELGTNDRAAITHIWSLFSAAPADQRMLILKGLLSTCCMPQLSFLHDEIKPLLRIDFVSILPHEVSLQIFSYMDAKSLCYAAQVSRSWRSLADDDALWHRMCEQHIDKKCTKCGWGLPLLDKKRQTIRKRSITTSTPSSNPDPPPVDSLRTPCGPTTYQNKELNDNDNDNDNGNGNGNDNSNSNSNSNSNKRLKVDPSASSSSSFDSFANDSTSRPPPNQTVIVRRRPWKEVYSERLKVERNWRNNKFTVRTLAGHTDGVMCVQFCDSSNIVITGGYDKTIRIFNMETGELIRSLKGHTRCIRALQFDDTKLVSGSMDATVKIWDRHTGECIRTLEGHTGGVLSLHFDCRLMVSGSTDHTIRVWNFQAGECSTLTGHTEWVNSVRLCQQNLLVSGSDDSTVRLWDLQTRTCLREFKGHVGQVQIALPSPKGFTHRLLGEEVTIDTSQRRTNGFRPGCDTTATERPTTTTLTTTATTTTTTTATTNESTRKPTSDKPASLSDAPIIISASLDNTVKIWNMETGACVRTLFGHVEGVWGLAYDTLRIVSGSHDKTIRVFDMDSGRCMHALEGHNGPVTAIALSDTKIVSCSDDGDVRIWDYGAY